MVKKDEILTKEGILLKVGDMVEITKSNIAWNKEMDKYHGKKVAITKIIESDEIRFDRDGGWMWSYSRCQHFKPVIEIHELW